MCKENKRKKERKMGKENKRNKNGYRKQKKENNGYRKQKKKIKLKRNNRNLFLTTVGIENKRKNQNKKKLQNRSLVPVVLDNRC